VNDFGGNCVYAAENARLAPGEKSRVVFFGDSITWLWNQTDPAFFRGTGRVDRGISGQTTAQMLVRYRQDVLDLHPAAVHILAGINDIAGNTGPTSLGRIEGNLATMAELAEAHHVRVILASVLPADVIGWRPSVGDPSGQVRELNAWLKDYAARRHFVYVDYYDRLKDASGGLPARYSADGVHPTPEGYRAMEPLALEALRAAGIRSGGGR
jgi:lysophospholipase L1-like esterase